MKNVNKAPQNRNRIKIVLSENGGFTICKLLRRYGEKGEEFVLTRAGLLHRGDLFSCSSDGSPAHHHAHWPGPENYEEAEPHQ